MLSIKDFYDPKESTDYFIKNVVPSNLTCFISKDGVVIDSPNNSPYKVSYESVLKQAVEHKIQTAIHDYIASGKCHCSEITLSNSSNYDGGELCISFVIKGNEVAYTTDKVASFTKEGYLILE